MSEAFIRAGGQWRPVLRTEIHEGDVGTQTWRDNTSESNIPHAGLSDPSDTGWHEFKWLSSGIRVEPYCRYHIRTRIIIDIGGYGTSGSNGHFRVDMQFGTNDGANHGYASSTRGMTNELTGDWHPFDFESYIDIPENNNLVMGNELFPNVNFHFRRNPGRVVYRNATFVYTIERWRRTQDIWVRAGNAWHRASELKVRTGNTWR